MPLSHNLLLYPVSKCLPYYLNGWICNLFSTYLHATHYLRPNTGIISSNELSCGSLLFSVCGHWFSVLYTRWFKKLSLFSPCSFLYRTERGVDWEWVYFRVSLQILLRQVGTCLDKEMFKTRYSSKLWKRICIFNHLESGKWVWKLQIKLYLVQMWWECSCKLSFCCPLELTPGES